MSAKTKNKKILVLIFLACFAISSILLFSDTFAASQKELDLSAYIINQNNKELTNGDHEIRFAIYTTDRKKADTYPSNSDQGERVWEETQNIKIQNGILNAILGTKDPLPDSLNFNGRDYYLGIRIDNDSEMVPRKKMTAVPLAINSSYLKGATTGNLEGNIPILGAGGVLKKEQIPDMDKLGEITRGVWRGSEIKNSFITDALSGKTYNALDLTSNSDGFSISGGDTSRTLSISGIDITLNQDISTASAPSFSGLTLSNMNGVLKASSGTISGSATTADLSEGTNLYYTDARARASISATGALSYSSVTGVINLNAPIPIVYGGTSATSIGSAGSVSYSTGSAYAFTDAGTSGQVLVSSGVGAPTWGTVAGGTIAADSLDMTELKDTLTLDANLLFDSSAGNYSFNIDSGTLFIDSANNRVGIGTTTPTTHLQIDGNVSATAWTTDGIAFDSNAATYTDTSTAALGTVAVRTANSFGAPTLASTNAITVTDAFTLYVPKPIAGTNTTITRANSAYFEGNVGIGTTTPGSYKLNVNGDLNVSGQGTFAGNSNALLFTNGIGGGAAGFVSVSNSTFGFYATNNFDTIVFNDSGNGIILKDSGNVGIGTTTPTSHLQIDGNISAAAWTTDGIAFDSNAATFTDTSTAGAGTVAVRTANSFGAPTFASTNAITVTDAFTLYVPKPIAGTNTTITRANSAYFEGNVGIGTTGPIGNLDIVGSNNGVIYLTGAGVGAGNALFLYAGNSSQNGTVGAGGSLILEIDSLLQNDNNKLVIQSPGNPLITVQQTGNVGIGATTPTAHLQIDGNISAAAWTTDGIAFDSNAATFTDTSTAGAGTVAVRTANSFGAPTFASTNAITVTDAFTLYVPKPIAGTNTTITRANSAYFEGNVGIGTTTPTAKLTVSGGIALSPIDSANNISGVNDLTFDGGGNSLTYVSFPAYANIYYGTDIQFISAGSTRMIMLNSGNVGIGATTPTSHLQIDGNISAAAWTTDGIAFDSNAATFTDTSTAAAGTVAVRTANSFGAPTLASTNAITVTDAFTLYVPKPIAGTNTTITRANSAYFEGNVGIGTTTPTALLHLNGSAGTVPLEVNSNETTATNNVLMLRSDVASADDAIFRVQANGAVYADGAYTGTGADYAEYFITQDIDLKSGEAVCVDTQKENAIKRCVRSGDNNVMGIVSKSPSVIGNNSQNRENDPNYKVIAMLGQINANAANENGPIQIGDSLTPATASGYLRKANPEESTVGVALQNFNQNQGSIQIMISRRNKSLTVEKVEEAVTQRIAEMNVEDKVNNIVNNATTKLTKNIETQITVLGDKVADLEKLTDTYETKSQFQEELVKTIQAQIVDGSGSF